jgi:tRNA G37 N-methylase TrmD
MRRSPHLSVATGAEASRRRRSVQPDLDGRDACSILTAMNASSVMSVAANHDLMSLATTRRAIDDPSAGGEVGLLLQARQLAEARSQLRQGETFSVTA